MTWNELFHILSYRRNVKEAGITFQPKEVYYLDNNSTGPVWEMTYRDGSKKISAGKNMNSYKSVEVNLDGVDDLDLIANTFAKIFPEIKNRLDEAVDNPKDAVERIKNIIKRAFNIDMEHTNGVLSHLKRNYKNKGYSLVSFEKWGSDGRCKMVTRISGQVTIFKDINVNNLDDLDYILDQFTSVFKLEEITY